VDQRLLPGHCEGDLIMGAFKRSYVGTVVERKTCFVILCKTGGSTTEAVLEGPAAWRPVHALAAAATGTPMALFRQPLAKGAGLSLASQEHLNHVASLMNGRPRKTSG
jgi:IS30 family transposase